MRTKMSLLETVCWWSLMFGCAMSQITYPKELLLYKPGRSARVICEADASVPLNNNPLHWYQQKETIERILYFTPGQSKPKDGKELKRVLYVSLSGDNAVKDPGFQDFDIEKPQPDTFKVKIRALDKKHSATYFCACWVYHVVMGQQGVFQDQISLTRSSGKTVAIRCKVSGLNADDYIDWYQKKEGEPFKRILYIKNDGSALTRDPAHPQNRDFSADKTGGLQYLRMSAVKPEHSGTYYCTYWKSHSSTETLKHSTKTSRRLRLHSNNNICEA
ncbi:hypothetical protein Z043_122600 [Scleropages formosus]|uniref:Ig-like domain-containing protein n=1 Tax=Scleropages formosus TaxID=113540 RepID=A0A0P7Y1D1_SCLFO|nr:hypothetical protein Z043_122600 [Scleropages formosus]